MALEVRLRFKRHSDGVYQSRLGLLILPGSRGLREDGSRRGRGAVLTQPQQDDSLSRGKGSKSFQGGTMSELGPIPQGQTLESSPSLPVLLTWIGFLSLPSQ